MSEPAVRLAVAPEPDPTPADPVEVPRGHRTGGHPPAPAPEPLLLTADQAAALCGVSPATWYRMTAAGRTPASIRVSRGCVRWRADDLRLWVGWGCVCRTEFEARRAASNGGGRPR
jgi:predicted DNA-binding transcriptional regulator AlpA